MSDEHVFQLAPALKGAQSKALRLLTLEQPKPPPPPESPAEPEPPTTPGQKIVGQGSEQNLGMRETKELVSKLSQELKSGQEIKFNIEWTIKEDTLEK